MNSSKFTFTRPPLQVPLREIPGRQYKPLPRRASNGSMRPPPASSPREVMQPPPSLPETTPTAKKRPADTVIDGERYGDQNGVRPMTSPTTGEVSFRDVTAATPKEARPIIPLRRRSTRTPTRGSSSSRPIHPPFVSQPTVKQSISPPQIVSIPLASETTPQASSGENILVEQRRAQNCASSGGGPSPPGTPKEERCIAPLRKKGSRGLTQASPQASPPFLLNIPPSDTPAEFTAELEKEENEDGIQKALTSPMPESMQLPTVPFSSARGDMHSSTPKSAASETTLPPADDKLVSILDLDPGVNAVAEPPRQSEAIDSNVKQPSPIVSRGLRPMPRGRFALTPPPTPTPPKKSPTPASPDVSFAAMSTEDLDK